MYYILQPFRVLWKVFFLAYFIVSLTVLYPFFNYLFSDKKRFPKAFKLMRGWAFTLITVPGIWMQIERRADLPKGPFIICPNHSSYLDIITMYRVFKKYFVFMGKMELNSWPMFNIFFTKGMNISVDRGNSSQALKAIERAKTELKLGHSVVIFPEGTIPSNAPKMKSLKSGAFLLAMETGYPIVPVTFTTNWKRLQAGAALRVKGGPGPSKVIIHAPLFPKDYAEKGAVQMKQDTFEIINKPLIELYGNNR